MAEQPSRPDDSGAPLAWRVPSWQTAALILVVCAAAAVNIYAHPSATIRTVSLVLGLASLAYAVVGLRSYFVVDDEGVAVRYLRDEAWLPWDEVDRVEIVSGVRGSDTIRFSRADGTYVDVPPSLLLPSRPTGRPRAMAQLTTALTAVEARRPGPRRSF